MTDNVTPYTGLGGWRLGPCHIYIHNIPVRELSSQVKYKRSEIDLYKQRILIMGQTKNDTPLTRYENS